MRIIICSLAVALFVHCAAADVIEVDVPYQNFISGVSGDDSAAVNRMLREGYDYRAAVPRLRGGPPAPGAWRNRRRAALCARHTRVGGRLPHVAGRAHRA